MLKLKEAPQGDSVVFDPTQTCDRCGGDYGKEVWAVILPSGKRLSFCNHHYNDHAEALVSMGGKVFKNPATDIA